MRCQNLVNCIPKTVINKPIAIRLVRPFRCIPQCLFNWILLDFQFLFECCLSSFCSDFSCSSMSYSANYTCKSGILIPALEVTPRNAIVYLAALFYSFLGESLDGLPHVISRSGLQVSLSQLTFSCVPSSKSRVLRKKWRSRRQREDLSPKRRMRQTNSSTTFGYGTQQ